MRRDIQINTTIGDMVLKDQNKLSTYSFQWVSESDLYLLGEITIPHTLDVNKLQTEGVKIEIPYTPIYKPFKIRIVRSYDTDMSMPVINPVDGSEWFEVYTQLWSQRKEQLRASQLIMVSQDTYILQLDNHNGIGYIWSDSWLDAVNIAANIQNRNLLLQCVPPNHYRYPTSGVGLVRFLHSNLSQTTLAHLLESEFKADKVTVRGAAFDSYTGDIELDLDFTEADASV
jgi:hypothetical protein